MNGTREREWQKTEEVEDKEEEGRITLGTKIMKRANDPNTCTKYAASGSIASGHAGTRAELPRICDLQSHLYLQQSLSPINFGMPPPFQNSALPNSTPTPLRLLSISTE